MTLRARRTAAAVAMVTEIELEAPAPKPRRPRKKATKPEAAPIEVALDLILSKHETPLLAQIIEGQPTQEEVDLAYEWNAEIEATTCGCGWKGMGVCAGRRVARAISDRS